MGNVWIAFHEWVMSNVWIAFHEWVMYELHFTSG